MITGITFYKFHFFMMVIHSLLGLGVVNAFEGRATWFFPGLGSCGKSSKSSDLIVALSTQEYDNGAHCGELIQIDHEGKSVIAQIADQCFGCDGKNIDLSESTFASLAPIEKGLIDVTWGYV